ncbi:hypothetical protein [Endozoicomonas euniceicola]|uniref:Uncharacterized protein n=1 Tax=Endozoicomonas euniceicola TaxID=1234143 RepID=A0ABY6GPB2_9GAMM|nr:hypothetical protein [Endozoicomonas euniceicola]UYM14535.1 hypothetical protein NX720_16750 [Endozoicomonas euniceicola]
MNSGRKRNYHQLLFVGLIVVTGYGPLALARVPTGFSIYPYIMTERGLKAYSLYYPVQNLRVFSVPLLLSAAHFGLISMPNTSPTAGGNERSRQEKTTDDKTDDKKDKTGTASFCGSASGKTEGEGQWHTYNSDDDDDDDGENNQARHNHGKHCPACNHETCNYAWQEPGQGFYVKQSSLYTNDDLEKHWVKHPKHYCNHGCRSHSHCNRHCRQFRASGAPVSVICVIRQGNSNRFLSLSSSGLLNLWERRRNGFFLLQDFYIGNISIEAIDQFTVNGNQVRVYGNHRVVSLDADSSGNWQGRLLTPYRTAAGILPDGRVVTYAPGGGFAVSFLEEGSQAQIPDRLPPLLAFHPLGPEQFIVATRTGNQVLLTRWTESEGQWQPSLLSQLPDTPAQLHIGGNSDELIVVMVPKKGEPRIRVIKAGDETGQGETTELQQLSLSGQQVIGVTGNGNIFSRDSSGHQIQVTTRTSGQWVTSSLLLESGSHLLMNRRALYADLGFTLPGEQYLTGQNLAILGDGRIVTTAINPEEQGGEYFLLWSRGSDTTWTYRVLGAIEETVVYLAELFPGRLTVCDDRGGIREISLEGSEDGNKQFFTKK